MHLRDTGDFAHGVGVPSLICATVAVLGRALDWRERRRTGSTYRIV